eukprot:TRINITY_DN9637_c0_g1_i1.p1 TRINITY_DN9637_c0_g1~~TRINITY_DN9637_c0_g1_i1.p1  ORF type:complete len:406 (+),score=63.96 TRINITY_DN9637_c0_g1_i1:616-1833(+)
MQREGKALWAGLAENPRKSTRQGWGAQGSLKDSSSTDVVVHAGKALSLFYQCGQAYKTDPISLAQEGKAAWAPSIEGISAHAKVDEETGELFFFNYSKNKPYCHYGVVDQEDQLQHYQAVELPGARLPHDMALSKQHVVLCDFPLFWDPVLLNKGIHATRFFNKLPSRFAVLPRAGGEVRWFEASPAYCLHFLNCWEEGEDLVLDGYRQLNPMPSSTHPAAPDAPKGHERMMVYLDMFAMQPRLHRWRFNLATGTTTEQSLDPERTLEFGTFNPLFLGKPYRFVYSALSKPGWFLFIGVLKTDLVTGETWSYFFGEDRYGSEAPFCARPGGDLTEDLGYLVTIVSDLKTNMSECVVLDAQRIQDGPIVRLKLPERVPSGTHSVWAPSHLLAGAQSQSASKLKSNM